MTPQKNVLIALGWYDHRLLQGIAAYATEHHWHLAAHSVIHERAIPWGWRGDGVLAWLAADDDLAEFVVSLKSPTVDFSLRRSHLPFAHVVLDHARTGTLVADHFLERGIQHFCYYSSLDNWTHEQRGDGFVNRLQERGHPCAWLRWHEQQQSRDSQGEWMHRREWLLRQLQCAPKPVGVFVADGSLAVEVQEICVEAGIAVPAEISLVGIEDYLLSLGSANRSISGVDTNVQEQGYQGAALLDRIMNGEPMPSEPIRIPPARIITRKSSDILAVAHPGVARALRYVADHFSEEVGVEELARFAGMSVRGLHQSFSEHIACTPGQKIRQVRLDRAKKLLAESNEKIEAIARQCGYPNINTFFIAFRKSEGTTPDTYRKANRHGR